MMKIKLTDYKRFFEVKWAPFVVSSIFQHIYHNMNAIVINKSKNIWLYLTKEKIYETEKEGLSIYWNDKLFNKYSEEFTSLLEQSYNKLDTIIDSEKITQKDIKNFFDIIFIFFDFYRKTEFFYTDKAYKSELKIVKNNLEKMQKLKFKWRTLLNNIFLGSKCYLYVFIKILAIQNNISYESLLNSFYFDIINIKKTDHKNIIDYILIWNQYLALTDLDIEHEDSKIDNNIIKWQIANKGILKWYVRVIEPDYDNFDSVNDELLKIKEWEILVCESTSPELMLAFEKISAVITNQWWMGSHAAILSREFNIPCIVWTWNASKILKSWDYVLLNANEWFVKKINQ